MKEKFIHFPTGDKESHFTILLAGISYCDGSYRIEREKSDCMVVEYVIKGRGMVVANGITYEAKAGDIYVLPVGWDHLYFSDKTEPWEKIWFNAAGTLTGSLLSEYNPRDIVVFQNAGGRAYVESIHQIGNDSTITAQEKHRKAAIVFHELLQYLYDKFYEEKCIYSKETILMKAYLDDRVMKNVSLKELGELVFLSESQVVRNFKRDIGKTPHEYCLEMKLDQAKKLLKNTRLMVKEIAEHLGFCDEHYFSYIFKRKMGRSPLEYRRNGEQ